MPYKRAGQKDFPYKKARLVNCGGDLSKRWYVIYYAWNTQEEKLQRKRIYVNEFKTAWERTEEAKKIINEINNELIAGAVIDASNTEDNSTDNTEEKDLSQSTLLNALEFAVELKKDAGRSATKDLYTSVWNIFKAWLIKTNTGNILLRDVTGKHMHKFFDYLRTEHRTKRKTKIENRTFNNYKQHITTFFNVFIERDALSFNPVHSVKKLAVEDSRNVAFTIDQKTQLKQALSENNPQLWKFVQIIYYTLMRPNELQHLRVKDIDLSHSHIHIPASLSKNKIARYPKITPGLHNVLKEMQLELYNPDDLLFTNLGTPGPQPKKNGENYFTRTHRDILDKLEFNSDYSLYSWKHTGVVDLYRAGVKEHYIMQQGGWRDVKVFQNYMRSLGLYTNEELVSKAPQL